MAKPDRPLNLALAQIDRPAWPSKVPDFGIDALPTLSETTLLTTDEAARLNLVAADRMTCRLTLDRFERFMAAADPRTLIVHAIDAEPATPLLAYWLVEHTAALRSFAERAKKHLACEVVFALPTELPDRVKKSLTSLTPARWLDARYPAGHWRLMPRATRISATSSLIIDVIAATDWAETMITGAAAIERPIVVSIGRDARYRTIPRGRTLATLGDAGESIENAQWFKGPRLIDQGAFDDEAIGDGELTFYREPRGDRSSSACVHCGACIAICPTRVDPVALLRASAHLIDSSWRSEAVLRRAGLDSCIECGLCTASCPSGIELHHAFAVLKADHAEHPHV